MCLQKRLVVFTSVVGEDQIEHKDRSPFYYPCTIRRLLTINRGG